MRRPIIYFILTIALVVFSSFVSNKIWAGGGEKQHESITVTNEDNTITVAQFGQKYGLPNQTLKKIFNLTSPSDLQKQVSDFGFSTNELNKKVNQIIALNTEESSKNWVKILIKGSLWIIFLSIVFVLLRKRKIHSRNRKWIYSIAVVIFGVIFGSDPSPMGTVKDAIVLFGSKKVIFPPRMIAFSIFILMVILANKFICSWGCQLGTLQDFIFRLNRDSKDQKGLFRQIKIPFVISNSIRILFFFGLTLAAFLWAVDIVEPIDPFKIFKPVVIGTAGAIFLAVILIAGIFIYRPWCHLFCPFGLVGWLAEKISIFKIKVDYDKCISCLNCTKACPSSVMEAILKQDKTIPDCFSCGNCIETCPVKAISFAAGKRSKPPKDKFNQPE